MKERGQVERNVQQKAKGWNTERYSCKTEGSVKGKKNVLYRGENIAWVGYKF